MRVADWLTAVSEDPETLDSDLIVATAIAMGGAGQADDVPGLDPERVADSIEELQALGYLESVVELPTEGETECLLELRLPI